MSLDVEAGKAAVAALELLAAAVLHVPELGDAYTGGKVVFYPSLKLVTIERIGDHGRAELMATVHTDPASPRFGQIVLPALPASGHGCH